MIEELILACLLFAAIVAITRPITVFVHELGHAVPALLFTREKVTIYVGSYGDPGKSKFFKIGLLEIWFRYNPFMWRTGVCYASPKRFTLNSEIFFTFAGPLASLLGASFVYFIITNYDFPKTLDISLAILLTFFLGDFILNLIPSSRKVQLHDGRIAYNDGHELLNLIKYKKYPREYLHSIRQLSEYDYGSKFQLSESWINEGFHHKEIYLLYIESAMLMNRLNEAQKLHCELQQRFEMDSMDHFYSATIKGLMNNREESLAEFKLSLTLNPQNVHSLINRAYLNIQWGNNEEALADLDNALSIDPKNVHTISSRGLAKLRKGLPAEALEDILEAIGIDPQNSYAIMHHGIYYQQLNQKEKARSLFQKAKQLNKFTYRIDQLIAEVS